MNTSAKEIRTRRKRKKRNTKSLLRISKVPQPPFLVVSQQSYKNKLKSHYSKNGLSLLVKFIKISNKRLYMHIIYLKRKTKSFFYIEDHLIKNRNLKVPKVQVPIHPKWQNHGNPTHILLPLKIPAICDSFQVEQVIRNHFLIPIGAK